MGLLSRVSRISKARRQQRFIWRFQFGVVAFALCLLSTLCMNSLIHTKSTTTPTTTTTPTSADSKEGTSWIGALQKGENSTASNHTADGESSLCGEATVDCESNYSSKTDRGVWAALYMLGILYTFVALAIVCDDYFVASLEVICDVLDLTPDVAGATFMAAGSSAPELFTSVMGVFVAKSDVGIGTILGSAVFNILVIIGLTALLAGQVLQLDWKPLARDSMFYMFSIILIILMFSNKRIDWYEPILLLVCYGIYLLVMKYNSRLMTFLDRIASPTISIPVKVAARDVPQLTQYTPQARGDRPPSFRVVAHLIVANIRLQKSAEQAKQRETAKEVEAETESDSGDVLDFPESAKDQLLWLISLPIIVLFKYTIPDCAKTHLRKYYVATFSMSVVWIAVLCLFMVDWSRALGCVLDIDPALMGLTLLAAGTSVPDALASLFVAQDGEGDMAVSNAIGSNVFDILLGLGLPWALSMMMSSGEAIPVCSEGIVKATIILFLVLVFVVGVLAFSGWKLSPKVGLMMFIAYFVFVVFSLLDQKLHLV